MIHFAAIRPEGIGLILVLASSVLSFIVAVIVGGFKIGSLEKTISLSVTQGELAAFLARLHLRLAELGFLAGAAEGQFLQSGAATGESGSFTHAKTKKQLSVAISDEGGPDVIVELSLRYLDPILGDSGESAYRDAVLDYVTGRIGEMRVVPNRSFMALSCLVGSVCAWIAFLFLQAIHFRPIGPPILILGLTEITAGVMAILAIKRKPREMTGTRLAILGISLSALVLIASGVMTLLAKSK